MTASATCRYVNGRRLVSYEDQVLSEGDIIAFRTNEWTFYSWAGPTINTPYVFRVEHLEQVFESSAAARLDSPAQLAGSSQGDIIDLTVSMQACALHFSPAQEVTLYCGLSTTKRFLPT